MAETDLRALRDAQRQTAQTLADRDALTASLAARSAELTRLEALAAQQARAGNAAGAAATRRQITTVTAARAAELTKLRAADEALRGIPDRIALVDPCDADGALPLLLLPVRVETRFTTDRASLRVRVFPDDVHIDQLDPGLDESEQAARQEYWSAAWRGTDDQADAAWKTLVERVGKRRAGWIAIGVPPTNLADRATAAAPVFGPVTPRARRAAVARLLPDRFVAVAIQGNDRRTAIGKPVAPEVTVGLLADDGSQFTEINGLKIMPGAEWIVDYPTAERLGMALTVPLARAATRVDRVIVLGVRRTLDAARTAAEVERLMRSHQFTRGLGFVPQGTATNNTEAERAGWRARDELTRPPRDVLPAPAEGTNAQAMASALGVDARLFAGVDQAAGREQPRARAASVLFWGSTWGTFLDKVNRVGTAGAALSDATIEKTRAFARDHVRGRGPLPALRVGNQPYGVLPVSALDALWTPTRGDALEADLLGLLRRARAKWRQSVANVPRVGAGNVDEVMREILGQSPVSGSLRVRSVLSEEAAQAGLRVSNGDANTLAVETLIEELVLEEVILDASLIHRTGSLGTRSRPLALPLAHDTDVAYMDALVGGTAPPKVKSVWQALLQLSWARAQREVDATGAKRFHDVIAFATAIPAADRQRVTATAANAGRMSSAALGQEADRMHALVIGNKETPTLAEFQPVPASRKGYGELAFQATSEAARGALASYAAWAHMRALARQAELREAMAELRTTTRGERRILIAETLDCASHRLDAWCTALVERRRKQRRATTPAGLTVGAYGWVEDVDPTGDRRGDGGYVAAPSLAHAATAGILRSAYLSHNGAPGGSGAFAIDLSSARVRTALHLVDGIRQGQPLGALLGYQIERAIHEARLDRLILSLRTVAPLTQGKLSDRGENVPLAAIEALAASNVVDGVDLVEKFQGKVPTWNAARIQTALNTKPQNNPYLTDAAWPALTPAEWAKVSRIIQDAAEACDAVADLLMAEGVHQLVMGNVARASAALDAAGGAETPPPEPQVIATPIEGVPITHRLLFVAGPTAAGRPWSAARPRALAEPRLEAWAGARLGDPATVRVTEMRTLAQTGLAALDLIHDAGNRTALEQRVRAALGLAPDTPLLAAPPPGSPAGTKAFGEVAEHAAALHTLLATARPATPSDLTRHSDSDTRAYSRADIDATIARATVAQGGLRAVVTELAGAIAAGPLNEAALRAALERAAAYGVAAPMVSGEQLQVLATASHAEAERRVADAETHLAAARAAMALPDAPTARTRAREAVVAAGQALFGEGFWLVPAIDAPAAPDLWQVALAPGALAVPNGAIRRFLADVGSVRQSVRRAGDALLLAEALGQPAALRVAQLATPGAPGTARWVGGALDPAAPSPEEPVTDCVVDLPAGYDGKGQTIALVVDQWTDVVPLREVRSAEAGSPVDERATAGVAFNANAPSARAPQAMLLAVSPNDARWTTDALLATVLDTLDLAKARLVTLERTNGAARVLPALYAQSWSLQGEPALDFSYLTGVNAVAAAVPPYVKE